MVLSDKKIKKLIQANIKDPVKVEYLYSMDKYSVFRIDYKGFTREVNINVLGTNLDQVQKNIYKNIDELIHEIRFTIFLAKSK